MDITCMKSHYGHNMHEESLWTWHAWKVTMDMTCMKSHYEHDIHENCWRKQCHIISFWILFCSCHYASGCTETGMININVYDNITKFL
jgi:hypothetical protein